MTKNIVKHKIKVKDEFLCALELNERYAFELGQGEIFYVTLLDANHCPGAVMFLFESGSFGTVLATGDFKYSPELCKDSILNEIQVDTCYIDNTYMNKLYSGLPSKNKAFNELLDLVDIKQQMHEHVVFSIQINLIGKTDLLIQLSEYFETKILVSPERFQFYTQILKLNAAHFCHKYQGDVMFFLLQDVDKKVFANAQIIQLNMTALDIYKVRRPNSSYQEITNHFCEPLTSYQIPYTEHSSYTELIEFAKFLRPVRFVANEKSGITEDISKLDEFVVAKRRQFSCKRCNKWWFCKVKYDEVIIGKIFNPTVSHNECLLFQVLTM